MKLGTHFADLVEKKRAAVGELEAALARIDRARKCAADMTEQLALEQFFGNGAAINWNKRPGLAGAQFMNRPRRKFFTGAALAGNQYRRIVRGEFRNQPARKLYARARPDKNVGKIIDTSLTPPTSFP